MNPSLDINLQSHNTFGVSVNAEYYYDIHSEDDLQNALSDARLPIHILGGGSNVLLTGDVTGSTFHINIKGIDIVDHDDDGELIRVGAGELWHDLVMWSVGQGYYGLENLSLIPGKVGAAPIQNIGAYGVEQESAFVALEAVELSTGNLQIFSHAECLFGYRDSYFKNEGKLKLAIEYVRFLTLERSRLILEEKLINLS